jgi:DNA end-binding protein Ku
MSKSDCETIAKDFSMPSRAIWKGNIHFKNIDVPVKLHTAVKEELISFHLLHKKDHVRLKQQMICAHEKLPVPLEEQVRGFKLEDGRYIIVDREELEQIEPQDNRIIEVHEFVKSAQIDPIFISHGYYLEPDVQSKAFSSLALALSEMDVVGICTWTMRKHTYIGALQMNGQVLCLNTLHYADEVVPVQALDLQDIALSEKELQIGIDLISHLTASF